MQNIIEKIINKATDKQVAEKIAVDVANSKIPTSKQISLFFYQNKRFDRMNFLLKYLQVNKDLKLNENSIVLDSVNFELQESNRKDFIKQLNYSGSVYLSSTANPIPNELFLSPFTYFKK